MAFVSNATEQYISICYCKEAEGPSLCQFYGQVARKGTLREIPAQVAVMSLVYP